MSQSNKKWIIVKQVAPYFYLVRTNSSILPWLIKRKQVVEIPV